MLPDLATDALASGVRERHFDVRAHVREVPLGRRGDRHHLGRHERTAHPYRQVKS